MQPKQESSESFRLPICPRPLYFSRQPQDLPVVKSQTLFQAYYEHAKINVSVLNIDKSKNILQQNTINQVLKDHTLKEKGCGVTEQNENSFAASASYKGQIVDEQSNECLPPSKNYMNFLKRSTANDTKNIPKNFGKAIISFVQKNQRIAAKCTRRYGISLDMFIRQLKAKKKILHSIRQLRSLWMEEDFIFAKPFRQLSYYFLRRAGHRYIFGSRVADFSNHLKYRYRLMKALKCPKTFNSIKI